MPFSTSLIRQLGIRRSLFMLIILIGIVFLIVTAQGSITIDVNTPSANTLLIKRINARQPNLNKISSLNEYYSLTGPNAQTDKGYYNSYYKPEALEIDCYIDTADPVITFETIHKEFIMDTWHWISEDPQNPSDPETANMQKIINSIRSGEALS